MARFAEVVGADASSVPTALRKVTHMNACKIVELGDVRTETKCGILVNQYDCYPQKWR
jgi:hypothetical protein